MGYLARGIVVCICVASTHLNAETFLNDSALLDQTLASTQATVLEKERAEVDDVYEVPLERSSAKERVDPGFTPSHEVMRETEQKREANDRLWQSIFSLF